MDGDTLDAVCAGQAQRIRLLRINTPERGQPGYAEASQALAELLGNGEILLEFETPGVAERGRFGRLLAYVHHAGRNTNLEMVRRGWICAAPC